VSNHTLRLAGQQCSRGAVRLNAHNTPTVRLRLTSLDSPMPRHNDTFDPYTAYSNYLAEGRHVHPNGTLKTTAEIAGELECHPELLPRGTLEPAVVAPLEGLAALSIPRDRDGRIRPKQGDPR
jgi:hypothetical protein